MRKLVSIAYSTHDDCLKFLNRWIHYIWIKRKLKTCKSCVTKLTILFLQCALSIYHMLSGALKFINFGWQKIMNTDKLLLVQKLNRVNLGNAVVMMYTSIG